MRRSEARRLLRAAGGLGAAVAASALCCGAALAQEDLRAAPERGRTVLDRPRPEVDPAGVRIGGFRLDASAGLDVGYDDNLLGTPGDRVSDGFTEAALRASLVSGWSVHALGVSAEIRDRRYFSESAADWTDWNATVHGRYDVSGDTAIGANYTHARQHLSVQSVDVQEAGLGEPVPYDVDQVEVSGSTRFNRIELGIGASYALYRYENVPGPGGEVSVFDYDTFNLRLGTGYEFAPGRLVTLGLRYQDVRYTNSASSDRDSRTYDALIGFRYDFNGIFGARIAIGYTWREYESPQFKSIGTPAVDASVVWNVTGLTTLSFSAGRAIRESIRSSTASYVSNYAEIRADHELLRNLLLSASVGLGGQEYEQPTQRAMDLGFGASATWLINRNLSLRLEYRYTDRVTATGGLQEFNQNVVLLRLRASL